MKENNLPELLPCPFCGGKARYLPFKAGFHSERVICDACDFHLEGSIAAWNKRADTSAIAANASLELADRAKREVGLTDDQIAFDAYIQSEYGGVTGFAKRHTASSARFERKGFTAGFNAALLADASLHIANAPQVPEALPITEYTTATPLETQMAERQYAHGWNACREAMLSVAPKPEQKEG